MKNWKHFLARFNRKATRDENPAEIERDAQFTDWLEEEAAFRARPKFQAGLRGRLLFQVVTKPAAKPQPSFWFRLAPAGIGLVAILIFTLVLAGNFSAPDGANITPVASGSTSDLSGEKLNSVYDQEIEDYVNLDEATKTLGFAPSLPQYLPPGYKLDNAALTYSDIALPGRTSTPPTPTIGATENVVAEPHGLQFQITSLKATEGNQVQVYQLRTPFAANDGPHFNVQGAQRFNPQAIQGAAGYFIQGVRWRVAYSSSSTSKMVTPSSRPRMTMPPFKRKGSTGKTVATPPKMKSSAKIAFSQNQASGSPSSNFFIDFQPRDDGTPARSLVWAKDGVLTVLVGGDSLSEDEIRRIADSFKPISRQ